MDAVGRKVESQVQFWSLLGPFLVLLSIAVLLFKVSIHWYFPVSALIGIPLCVKWKMKGMAIALCTLLLLSGIGYQNLELDDRYWHVGLALAMAFSFIVMTLSLEEVQGLVARVQLESQSRLDNFVLLDERLKAAELEWGLERERVRAEAAVLNLEVAKAQDEKQTFHKLAQLAKDELIQVRGQHEQLLQDLYYKKQQIAQLHERIEETELSLQDFVNSAGEKQIAALTGQVAAIEREKEVLKARISLAQNDAQAVQAKLAFLEEERQAHLQANASLQQQCEQMRQVETQQRLLLQQAQQKNHELKIKLMEDEQQHEGLQVKAKELTEQVNRLEKLAVLKEEQCTSALHDVKSRMEEQKNHFEAQLVDLKRQAALQSTEMQRTASLECKALQEKTQKIQQELLLARQCLEDQNHQLIQFQQKAERDRSDLQQLQMELQEQKERFDSKLQEAQLHAVQGKLQHQKAAEETLTSLREQNKLMSEELQQANNELEAKREALLQAQSESVQLRSEAAEQGKQVAKTGQHIQELEELKAQLEDALRNRQAQLQHAEKQEEALNQKREKLPYAPGNTRHIESMYLQLKEQFQEKCKVLDTTRRQLFQINEELLRHQKDLEEEKVYGMPDGEKSLQRDLVRLGRQFDQMQRRYQQENDELAELVEHLLQELSQK